MAQSGSAPRRSHVRGLGQLFDCHHDHQGLRSTPRIRSAVALIMLIMLIMLTMPLLLLLLLALLLPWRRRPGYRPLAR